MILFKNKKLISMFDIFLLLLISMSCIAPKQIIVKKAAQPLTLISETINFKITSPSDKSIHKEGSIVKLMTNANNSDKQVQQVEFWKDNWKWVSTLKKPPYDQGYKELSLGDHILRSRVTYIDGSKADSQITINIVKVITEDHLKIMAPDDLMEGKFFYIHADAFSHNGIKHIEFWKDQWSFLGTENHPPYKIAIDGLPAGEHRLMARYTDNQGHKKSTFINITVAPIDLSQLIKPTQVGINMTWIENWEGQYMFIDAFKQSTIQWQGRPNDQSCYGCIPIELDKNGWVTRLEPDTFAEVSVITRQAPEGVYTIIYDGEGVIEYRGSEIKILDRSSGRDLIAYTRPANKGGFVVQIKDTNPLNYIRNIRVISPGGICSDDPYQHVNGASECEGDYTKYEKIYKSQIFHATFLNEMKGVAAIRHMDSWNINLNRMREPQEMRRIESSTWSKFMPIKAVIKLSNLLNADIWLNLPQFASENFSKHVATEIKIGLKSKLKVYLEHTNEIWNVGPGFPNHALAAPEACSEYSDLIAGCDHEIKYQEKVNRESAIERDLLEQAAKLGKKISQHRDVTKMKILDEDLSNAELSQYKERIKVLTILEQKKFVNNGVLCEGHNYPWVAECGEAVYRDHVDKTIAHGNIFKSILGNDKVITTLGSQAASPHLSKQFLLHKDSYKKIDALAIAPYFGHNFTNQELSEKLANGMNHAVEEFFDHDMIKILKYSHDLIKTHRDLAWAYSVDLIAYEGGPHITAYQAGTTDANPSYANFISHVSTDRRMGDAVKANLEDWQKLTGAMFIYYKNYARSSKQYYWGLKEYVGQDINQTPKYQALMDFIKSLPAYCDAHTVICNEIYND